MFTSIFVKNRDLFIDIKYMEIRVDLFAML